MMTSEPLQLNLKNIKSFVGDSPVKTYQLQAFRKVLPKKQGQDSSLNSCESYAWYDHNTLSWRTWQRSLIEGWTLYSGSFPKQGMMQNGQLYQQVLWEPAIKEADGGSLPTPIASKAIEQKVKFKQGGTPLLAALLPTPTASDVEGGVAKDVQFQNGSFFRENKQGVRWGVNLRDAVSILPTPTTMDHLPQRSVGSMLKQVTEHRKGRTNLANLREAVNPQAVELFNHLQSLPTPTAREWKDGSSQSLKNCKKQHTLGRAIHHTYPQNGENMYLNPCFVEEMMGYEIGWPDLAH